MVQGRKELGKDTGDVSDQPEKPERLIPSQLVDSVLRHSAAAEPHMLEGDPATENEAPLTEEGASVEKNLGDDSPAESPASEINLRGGTEEKASGHLGQLDGGAGSSKATDTGGMGGR
jgi:hypothetical protein